MVNEEKMRALIAALDVVSGPKFMAVLKQALDICPEIANGFSPTFDWCIEEIRAHQREEKQRWRDVN